MKFINKNQFTQIVTLILFSFIVMMSIRLTLYNMYITDFANLTNSELFSSLFMGFRVDTITLFTFSSLFILLLLFIKNSTLRLYIGLLWGAVLNTIFVMDFSDVLYFDYIHRHISSEIFNLGNDLDIIFGMAFGSMLPYTLGALFFSLGFLGTLFFIFSRPLHSFVSGKKLFITSIVMILILFGGIRNSLGHKSFGSSDAFAVNKISSGNLALNGVFTIYRTAKKSRKHNLHPLKKAILNSKELLASHKFSFIDSKYPLMKHYKENKEKKNYNVVIVLLESFGAEHIDGFTHYKELNVTPYLKELANNGLKFSNFYANGYRSIFGITSIFTGVTMPAGKQYLGKGLELSNLNYLGQVAKENGYSTLSIQAAHRRSYRIDAVSHLAGFDQYYGSEDIPNVETVDQGRAPLTGTYDYNMLNFYHKKLNTLKEPFLGFAFTASTHSDFYLPSKKFERYPHDKKNYNGALNAFIYTDDAIKRFMKSVENEPWFKRTIFIFTSDHGNGDALNTIAKKYRTQDKPLDSIEHFRIPLILYAPDILKPQVINTLGSHNDIFPTIVDMLGWKADITAFGNSLFDKSIKKRFVYFYGGNIIGLITDDGFMKHNFKNIVEYKGEEKNRNSMKNILFSVDTAQAQLLEKNRWTK